MTTATEAPSGPKVSSTAEQPFRVGIRGMTCASCVRRVERALSSVPGVEQANVNLATDEASIVARDVPVDALRAAVDRAGYELRLADEGDEEAQDALEAERRAEYGDL